VHAFIHIKQQPFVHELAGAMLSQKAKHDKHKARSTT
jgi:hypothetical protein